MKRLNNKGLSLVELLISIAVFSIVMVAMFTMLSTATKSYNKNRAEAQAQNEAQSLMSQLENIIQDATQGVYVKTNDVFAPDNKMVVCYDDWFSMLWWDGTDVYFFKFDGVADPNLAAGSGYKEATSGSSKRDYAILEVYTDLSVSHIADYRNEDKYKFILAENIESISIVPNNTYSYVSVSFVVNVDGSKYTAKKNIEIRNSSEKRSSISSGGSGESGSNAGEGENSNENNNNENNNENNNNENNNENNNNENNNNENNNNENNNNENNNNENNNNNNNNNSNNNNNNNENNNNNGSNGSNNNVFGTITYAPGSQWNNTVRVYNFYYNNACYDGQSFVVEFDQNITGLNGQSNCAPTINGNKITCKVSGWGNNCQLQVIGTNSYPSVVSVSAV